MRTYPSEASSVHGANGAIPTLNMGGMHASFVAVLFPQAYTVSVHLPELHKAPVNEALNKLTERQRVVAQKIARGDSSKVIAADLQISEGAANAHVTAIFRRLGIKRRGELPKAIGVAGNSSMDFIPRLAPSQARALALVADGHSNKMIAAALGITEATVKVHLTNVYRRLGVHNRAAAAAKYLSLRPAEG